MNRRHKGTRNERKAGVNQWRSFGACLGENKENQAKPRPCLSLSTENFVCYRSSGTGLFNRRKSLQLVSLAYRSRRTLNVQLMASLPFPPQLFLG